MDWRRGCRGPAEACKREKLSGPYVPGDYRRGDRVASGRARSFAAPVAPRADRPRQPSLSSVKNPSNRTVKNRRADVPCEGMVMKSNLRRLIFALAVMAAPSLAHADPPPN